MRRRIGLAGLLLFAATELPAASAPQISPRALFLQTDAALRDGEDVDVAAVINRLDDYPLAPYLRYRELAADPDGASAGDMLTFRERHADLPVAAGLEARWLTAAGAARKWQAFRRVDRGHGGARIACYRLRAERADAGVDARWLDRARELWIVGRSQPDACDPVFEELYARDALSPAQRWERVGRLMTAGQTGTARSLREHLDGAQQVRLDRWLAMAADPAAQLADLGFAVDSEWAREIVEYGFRRLGASDHERALELLSRYRQDGRLAADRLDALQRHAALQAAYSRHPRALRWLDDLPSPVVNDRVREWRARVALGSQDWRRLRAAVSVLPPSDQMSPEWTYWRGVALARTGHPERAANALEPLSTERRYYGFLAADLLGRPYNMNHEPAARREDGVRALAGRPGMIRARELFEIGFHEEARREWHAALAGANATVWADAAQLALDWGWYGRVVNAAANAGLHDALELRFPLAFREQLAGQAEAAGIDLALAYALIRKESAFESTAISRVGARGLMQVMPRTARYLASELGEDPPGVADLLDPAVNLRYGSVYLDRMLDRFDGNLLTAAAAYNAGPTRAEGWLRDNAGQPGPVWVENITYGETRDYVKSILAFRVVFDWQLSGEARRITDAMSSGPAFALSETTID